MAVLSRRWLFCAGDTCRQCHPVEVQTEEEDQTPPAPRLGASDDVEGEERMEQLIETLAERSHNGWMQEKQRQGFADHAWCPVKAWNCCDLPREKHHPDMLPYADLAENVKEYDRETVKQVLEGIEFAGYRIVKAD